MRVVFLFLFLGISWARYNKTTYFQKKINLCGAPVRNKTHIFSKGNREYSTNRRKN